MKFYFFHAPAEVGSYWEYAGWWTLSALQLAAIVLAFVNYVVFLTRILA